MHIGIVFSPGYSVIYVFILLFYRPKSLMDFGRNATPCSSRFTQWSTYPTPWFILPRTGGKMNHFKVCFKIALLFKLLKV